MTTELTIDFETEDAAIETAEQIEEPTELETDAPAEPSPEAARLAEIKEAREQVRRCKWTLISAKEEAKDARESYDAAVERLTAIIDTELEHLPLFDGKPLDGTAVEPSPVDWRRVSIDELGLQPTLTEKLREAGIETMGQLEDLRAGAGLQSVAGIGRAKADKIEDAVIAWLSEHRDQAALHPEAGTNGELQAEGESNGTQTTEGVA